VATLLYNIFHCHRHVVAQYSHVLGYEANEDYVEERGSSYAQTAVVPTDLHGSCHTIGAS